MRTSPSPHAPSLIALLLVLLMAGSARAITVTSSADAGGTCPGANCTLRQAIATAAAGDTIDFTPGLATITLTSGELLIDKALTIVGPGAGALTVQRSTAPGAASFRIIDVNSGFANFSISGLTLSNGKTDSESIGGKVGGGILSTTFGTVTITGCVISGNTAGAGGGFYKSGAGGTANISNTTFSSNSAVTTGGGIYNSGSGSFGTVSLTNCTVSGNTAHDAAGIFNTGKVNLTNSTVSGNASSAGAGSPSGTVGAIYNRSVLNVTNSTISGNSATDSSGVGAIGGGIYNYSAGTTNLTNATISGNTASSTGSVHDGGGVYNDFGTVNSKNTIIAKNTAVNGPDFFGTLSSQGYNLIGNNSGANITSTTGDQIGTSTSPIDPILGPLQNNGGPTFTQELFTGSPAIDAGAAATDPATGAAISTDQRGFPRPVDNPSVTNAVGGDGSDIGAFELQPDTPTPTPTATATATATPTATATATPTATATAMPTATATATTAPTATATPIPTATATATPTATATATPTATPTTTPINVQLLNISGRIFIQT
jgi:CSLREA domain-containing protein